MLYSTLIIAASAFAGLVSAQNDTAIPCCSVPANTVPQNLRSEWCAANQNTCVDLCGGPGQIASNGNDCSATDLKYSCKCSNGTDISSALSTYQQTVPALMCFYWFGACINATGTDVTAQFRCTNARDTKCGNATTKAQASASPSGSAARTSGGSTPSATSGGATQSSGAAAPLGFYATPALAGGLLAVFGLAL